MKYLATLLFVLLTTINLFAQERQVYQIPAPVGGLNIKYDSTIIKDNTAVELKNLYLDKSGIMQVRDGFTLYATLPEPGTILSGIEYKKSNGETFLLVQIDSNVYSTKDTGVTWSTVKTGLNTISPCTFAISEDEVIATNGIDVPFSYNGSTSTSYGFIPNGKFVASLFDTLYIANVPGFRNYVFFSTTYNGYKDSLGWQSNNAIKIENNGESVTGIFPYKDQMITFTENSTWGLLGLGSSIERYKYSGQYGCVSNGTIQEKDGKILFMSKSGLCEFNNGIIRIVDEQIEPLTTNATVTNGTVIQKSLVQSTAQDFSLGTSSGISVNNILSVLQQGDQELDNSIVDENQLYDSGSEYYPLAGGVYAADVSTAVHIGIVHFDDIAAGTHTVKNISVNLSRSVAEVRLSSVTLMIYNPNGTLLAYNKKYITDLPAGGKWYTFFDTFTYATSSDFIIKLSKTRSSTEEYAPGSALSYYTYYYERPSGEAGAGTIEKVTKGYYSLASREIDKIAMASEGWTVTKDWYNNGGGTFRIHIWTDYERTIETTRKIRRLAYRLEYTLENTVDGFYASQQFNAGTKISAWKEIITKEAGTGIEYSIRYATSSANLSSASYVRINSGDIIQATTSQHWIQWRADFDDNNQRVYAVELRWLEGESSDYQNPTSAIYDNRYHVAFATSGVTNNVVIVRDRFESYYKWVGINAGTFIPYDNKLLFSNGNKLYRMYNSNDDNGTPITWEYKSKDFDFGIMDIDKRLERLSVTHKSTGTVTFNFNWKNNYATTFTTSTVSSTSTMNNKVFNVPTTSAAKYWQFQCTGTKDTDIQNMNVYFNYEPLIER